MLSCGQEQAISVKGYTFAAITYGDLSKPMILAFHGWLDNAASFSFLAPLLEDYHVVALDFLGHGHSSHYHASHTYQITDMMLLFPALLKELDVEEVILLGHSMGAAIATLCASACPDLVSHLILLDGLVPLIEPADSLVSRMSAATNAYNDANPTEKKLYSKLERLIKIRMHANQLSEDQVLPIILRGSRQVGQGYQWRFDDKLLLPSVMYFTLEQVEVLMRNLLTPTLLISASQGLIALRQWVAPLLSLPSNLEHIQVEGPHHIHIAQPEIVANWINTWLVRGAFA